MTNANWKNVNNWHWVEKNCASWASEYFTTNIKGTAVESEEYKLRISDSEVTGECDVNVRKGKILYFYDLVVKLEWKGTRKLLKLLR
jgi:activator of HSP90 ATPase